MADIELDGLLKIFPYAGTGGVFGRKKRREMLERQRAMPYTTNEGVVVLQHISARIRSGEFVVLLGPSGCGKTTLLRLIAGLESPTLGEIRFDGRTVNPLPPEERDVAMVFQNYSLYPHLTVFDNIAFPLRAAHMPRAELEETVCAMAEILEMEECLPRLPAELSGGQMQRAAIARALVRKPQVFLMDEPFSNLDAPLRAELRRYVKRLHQSLGATFLYVTHDHNEALSLGQRILVMRDGMVEQDGTPAEIYFQPANAYVAASVGTPPMNLFEGGSVAEGRMDLLGRRFRAPAGAVAAGVQPVNVLRAAEGIPASVLYTERLGSEAVIHMRAADREITAVWEADQAAGLFPGQNVYLHIPQENLHYFDADGKRIRG